MNNDNIFNKLMNNDYDVFSNMRYLDADCIPNEFPYRDLQMTTIASNMMPLIYQSTPLHTVLLGGSSVGKTTSILKVFESLKDATSTVVTSYVNCRIEYTPHKIYSRIYEDVTGREAPRTGSGANKILSEIIRYLETTHNSLVVALDDVNSLLGSDNNYVADPNGQKVIYDLTRANEIHNVHIGLYPIVMHPEFKYKFEINVSSSFKPAEVMFDPYTHEQVYNIIKQRCEYAFKADIVTSEMLERITLEVEKNNIIRDAWIILKNMGNRVKFDHKEFNMDLLEDTIDILIKEPLE